MANGGGGGTTAAGIDWMIRAGIDFGPADKQLADYEARLKALKGQLGQAVGGGSAKAAQKEAERHQAKLNELAGKYQAELAVATNLIQEQQAALRALNGQFDEVARHQAAIRTSAEGIADAVADEARARRSVADAMAEQSRNLKIASIEAQRQRDLALAGQGNRLGTRGAGVAGFFGMSQPSNIAIERANLKAAQAELRVWESDLRSGKVTAAEAVQNIQRLNSGMMTSQRTLQGLQKGFLGTGDHLDKIVKKVATWAIATGAVFAVIRGIESSVKNISQVDFERASLAKLYRSNDPNEQTRAGETLTRAAAGLGAQFGENITGVQKQMQGFVRQGYDINETIFLTNQSLRLQKATALEAAEAQGFLTSQIEQYNLSLTQTAIQVDALNQLENTFAAETKETANAIGKAASAARESGVEIEELGAIMAATLEATKGSTSGSSVGVAYKTIFARLASPETIKALEDVGIQINFLTEKTDQYGKKVKEQKDAFSILQELAAKWEYLDVPTRKAVAIAVAGQRQWSLLSATMNNFGRVLDGLREQYDSMNSASVEVARMQETILGKVEKLKAVWTAMVADTENTGALNDTIKNVLDNLIRLTETIDATDPQKIKIWADAISALFGALAGWRAGGGGKAGGILAVVGGITGLAASEATFGESVRDTNEAIGEQAKKLQQLSQDEANTVEMVGSYEQLAREIEFAQQNLTELSNATLTQEEREKKRTVALERLTAQVEAVRQHEIAAGRDGESAILKVLDAEALRNMSIRNIITLLGTQKDAAIDTAEQERKARMSVIKDEMAVQSVMIQTHQLRQLQAGQRARDHRDYLASLQKEAEEGIELVSGRPAREGEWKRHAGWPLQGKINRAFDEERRINNALKRGAEDLKTAYRDHAGLAQRYADLYGYSKDIITPGGGSEPDDDGTDKTARAGRDPRYATGIRELTKIEAGKRIELSGLPHDTMADVFLRKAVFAAYQKMVSNAELEDLLAKADPSKITDPNVRKAIGLMLAAGEKPSRPTQYAAPSDTSWIPKNMPPNYEKFSGMPKISTDTSESSLEAARMVIPYNLNAKPYNQLVAGFTESQRDIFKAWKEASERVKSMREANAAITGATVFDQQGQAVGNFTHDQIRALISEVSGATNADSRFATMLGGSDIAESFKAAVEASQAVDALYEKATAFRDSVRTAGLDSSSIEGLTKGEQGLWSEFTETLVKHNGRTFAEDFGILADYITSASDAFYALRNVADEFQRGELSKERLEEFANLGIYAPGGLAYADPGTIRDALRSSIGARGGMVAGGVTFEPSDLQSILPMLDSVGKDSMLALLVALDTMGTSERQNKLIPAGSTQQPFQLTGDIGKVNQAIATIKGEFVKAILDNATRSIADVDRVGSLIEQIQARESAGEGLQQGLLDGLDPEQRQQITDKMTDLADQTDELGAKLFSEGLDAFLERLKSEQDRQEQTIALAEKSGGKSAGDIVRGATFRANEAMFESLLTMALKFEEDAKQKVAGLTPESDPKTAEAARQNVTKIGETIGALRDKLGLNEAERGGFLADLADDLTKATKPISDELSKLRQETARQGLGTIARSVMEINDKADELLDKVLFDIAAKYAAMAAAIDPSALEGLSALQAQDEAAARGQLDQLRKGRIGNQLRGTIEEMDLAAGERGTARSMRRQQLGLIGASPLQQQIGQVAIALASERARIAMKRDKNLKRGQQLGPDGQPLLNDDQMKDLRDGYRKEEIEAEEDASDRIVEIYRNRFVELRNMHQDFFKSIIMDIGSVESAFKRLSTQIISDSVDRMLEGWGVLGGLAGGNMRGAYGLPGGGRMGGVMPYAAAGGAMAGGMMIQGSNGQMIPVAMSPNAASGKAASKGYAQLPSYEQLGITPKTAGSYSGLGGSNTISQAIGFSGIGLNAYQSKNPLSSTLSGGVQGFALGGPLGAAIGGGVGLLGSLIGGLFGGRKADPRKDPDPYSLPTQADLQFAAPWLLPRQAFLGGRTGGGAEMVDQSQNFEIHGDLVFPSVTDEASAEGAARAFRRELSSGRSDVAVKLQAHLDRVPVSR